MLQVLFLLLTALGCRGHSTLTDPPSRNQLKHERRDPNDPEWCQHCLQAGGPDLVKERGGGVWPSRLAPMSHGLCGDPVQGEDPTPLSEEPYLRPTAPGKTYIAGSIVEFEVTVSTHHRGHYEFRICDMALDGERLLSAAEGQACLDKWELKRAEPYNDCVQNDPRGGDCAPVDKNHPGRWYLPPSKSGDKHRMRYVIPAGLKCEHCTLQWYWSSGNTCLYDSDYFTYFRDQFPTERPGWNLEAWSQFATNFGEDCGSACCGPKSDGKSGKYGEEFWNCADISVKASTGSASTSTSFRTTTTTSITTISTTDLTTTSDKSGILPGGAQCFHRISLSLLMVCVGFSYVT